MSSSSRPSRKRLPKGIVEKRRRRQFDVFLRATIQRDKPAVKKIGADLVRQRDSAMAR